MTIFGSAVLYLAFGYSTPAGTIQPIADLTDLQSWLAFIANPNWQIAFESLQLSISTFGVGTMGEIGTGDIEPLGYSALVVTYESFFSGFLYSLFGFVLARRLP